MKDIKNRIKSVEGTRQITKAMELVAASKLKKARERIEKSRPYFEFLKETILDIKSSIRGGETAFFSEREIKKTCYVVIAGDRGLAGGFNTNLFKKVLADADKGSAMIVPIGRKAAEFFERQGFECGYNSYKTAEDVGIADCYNLGRDLCAAYSGGEFDRLCIYYMKFVSMMSQLPVGEEVLPLKGGDGGKSTVTLYEPGAEATLEKIVPMYVSGVLYGAMAESQTSEFAARRMAMDSASKNADEMIENLTQNYNRARQAAITQEITEIVSGAQEQ